MDDQQQYGETMTKDWADLQMPETARELFFQSEPIEQRFETGPDRQRAQALVFESNPECDVFCDERWLCYTSSKRSPLVHWFGVVPPILPTQGSFLLLNAIFVASFLVFFWIALLVNSSYKRMTSSTARR